MNPQAESRSEIGKDEEIIKDFLFSIEHRRIDRRDSVLVINDKEEAQAAASDEEAERKAAHQHKMGVYKQQKDIRIHQIATIRWIKRCTFWWMVAVLFFLFCSSIQTDDINFWGWKIKAFTIDSSVAIAFITTTTANVLGGLWIVMHWLYKK